MGVRLWRNVGYQPHCGDDLRHVSRKRVEKAEGGDLGRTRGRPDAFMGRKASIEYSTERQRGQYP